MGLKLHAIKDTLWQHSGNLGNNKGTHWNFFKNMMGTHHEPKKRKITPPNPSPPTPNPPQKSWGPLNACCTFPFVACDFYFQNY